MNFSERLEWLYQLRGKNIKLGLEPTRNFLKYLDLDSLPFKVIHIAGTNGKGSVAFFIYSLLMRHGLKTALYTSPHIDKFNERIRINDRFIDDAYIDSFLQKHESFITESEITFFETTTAMAFAYMAEQKVDVAVIETGLGGRFDATNVVDPVAVGITRVAKDHKEFLGDDLSNIAMEKLGIVKQGRPVFSTIQEKSLIGQFEDSALAKNTSMQWSAAKEIDASKSGISFMWRRNKFLLSMLGDHQAHNAAMALDISSFVLGDAFSINESHQVFSKINWPGRIELYSNDPPIILDVAHNEAALKTLFLSLKTIFPEYQWVGVMAVMKDKDLSGIFPLMKQTMIKVYCHHLEYYRSLPASELKKQLNKHHIPAEMMQMDDLKKIINGLRKGQGMVILGTHYILAETLRELNSIKKIVKRLTKD